MRRKKNQKYVAKIIRAPALLNDAKIFLYYWDPTKSEKENIQRAYKENIFGRKARSYSKQIITAFKERYILKNEVRKAIRNIVCSSLDSIIVDRILYYHAALADPLIYDFVTQFLYELQLIGQQKISINETENYIARLCKEGKTTTFWSKNVQNRVARNLLTSLRDFHILEGKVKKQIAPVYLPIKVFIYIAFYIHKNVISGDKILNHSDWKLFLLDSITVERLFIEADQLGYLKYNSAGRVIQIKFKQKSIMEVANAITQ